MMSDYADRQWDQTFLYSIYKPHGLFIIIVHAGSEVRLRGQAELSDSLRTPDGRRFIIVHAAARSDYADRQAD